MAATSSRFPVPNASEIPPATSGGCPPGWRNCRGFQVDGLLFEGDDPGLEPLGVVRPADADLAPDLVAERLAEAGFETADLGGEPGGAGVGRQEVGLQGGPADRGATAAGYGGWLGWPPSSACSRVGCSATRWAHVMTPSWSWRP